MHVAHIILLCLLLNVGGFLTRVFFVLEMCVVGHYLDAALEVDTSCFDNFVRT